MTFQNLSELISENIILASNLMMCCLAKCSSKCELRLMQRKITPQMVYSFFFEELEIIIIMCMSVVHALSFSVINQMFTVRYIKTLGKKVMVWAT